MSLLVNTKAWMRKGETWIWSLAGMGRFGRKRIKKDEPEA
jgi:hypothetical protein